jgi:hypothetical protein
MDNNVVPVWVFLTELDIFMENAPYRFEPTSLSIGIEIFELTFEFIFTGLLLSIC